MTVPGHSPRGALPLRWFFLVVVFVVAAYANSFSAEFQFDDYEQIWESPLVHDPTLGSMLQWGRTRLVPFATFAANYYWGGANVVGYHLVNLLVHLLVCFVVYRLIGELCRTPRLRDTWVAESVLPIALAAAIVVGCHPIQVQAVTYIWQRVSLMVTLFYTAAVYCYVRFRNDQVAPSATGRRWAWYVAALACAVLAYFSKENAVSLPFALLLTEWVFFRANGTVTSRGTALAPFLVLALAIPLTFRVLNKYLPPVSEEHAEARGTGADALPQTVTQEARLVLRTLTAAAEIPAGLTPFAYFVTQCRVIPMYLRLVMWPKGFTIDHDVPIEYGWSFASISGLVLLVAIAACGMTAAARRGPLVGFGILWFFVALSVESSVLPIRDVMNEHRMYLAMPGVALLAGLGFAALWRWQRSLAVVVAGAVCAVFVVLTAARNEVWSTQLSLWGEALRLSPNKPRVHVNYGTALHLKGEVKEAVKHYCEALRLEPANRRAESNINVALADLMDQDEVDMEFATTGPNGEMELVPRHPCPPKKH